jgi:hypothetical protein
MAGDGGGGSLINPNHNSARSGDTNEAAHRSFDFGSVSARRRDVQVILVAEYHASFAMTLNSSPLVEHGKHIVD